MSCIDCNDDDKYVKISTNDTKSSFLRDKLIDGEEISFVIVNPGENEKLKPVLNISPLEDVSPDLVIASSDGTVLSFLSGDKNHIANLRVKISSDPTNAITKTNGLYVPGPNYTVKLNIEGIPEYLEDLIQLKADPLGIVIPQAITQEDGKLNIGYTLDLVSLCASLQAMECYGGVQNCNIIISSIATSPNENGSVIVTLVLSGGVPTLYQYKIGEGGFNSVLTNPFTITGLSGVNTLQVRAMCSNGIYSNTVTKAFIIPNPLCSANLSSVSSSNSNSNGTISISWAATGASYYTYQIDSGSIITTNSTSINLTGQSVGNHVINIVVYCSNFLQGNMLSTTFSIPVATCSATISSITVNNENPSGTATVTWVGVGASGYKWKINNGTFTPTSSNSINLTGLSIGTHIIYIVPICANGIEGTQNTANIVISPVTCTVPTINIISDVAPTTFRAYYGYKPTNVVLTSSQIEAGLSNMFSINTDVLASYTANGSTPSYLWVAIPTSEPIRTSWYVNTLDNGTFAPDQTFGIPVIVGAYYFYQSNYQTAQPDTIVQFKV